MKPALHVLGTSNETSGDLVEAFRTLGIPAQLIEADDALGVLGADDTALARLDVRQTLDGVEPGLLATLLLERRGVHVLNPVSSLLAAHDKLRTARLLDAAGGYFVLEVNAAAEFDDHYSIGGRDVFREAASRLGLLREPAAAAAY